MSDLRENPTFEELTQPCEPSTDPDYLAWKERKIRKALEQAQDRSTLIPAAKVWEKLGLER